MSFVPKTFGINLSDENNLIVEEVTSLDNLPRYQFLFKDKLTNSYNGNHSYGFDIQQLSIKNKIELEGWKVNDLYFSGNWYGEWGVCILEDKYGETVRINVTNQSQYVNKRQDMIIEAFNEIIQITQNNFSRAYYEFMEQKDIYVNVHKSDSWGVVAIEVRTNDLSVRPSNNKCSYKGFKNLIAKTKDFIERYDTILHSLEEEKSDKNTIFIDNLNKHFYENLKTYYSYTISDLEESTSSK